MLMMLMLMMQLSFPVFVMALMAFVGWFLFVIFGGLGIAGIPIDCIRVCVRSITLTTVLIGTVQTTRPNSGMNR